MCSVGLIRSFCPSCMLLGILMLPLELLVRLIRRVVISGSRSYDDSRA